MWVLGEEASWKASRGREEGKEEEKGVGRKMKQVEEESGRGRERQNRREKRRQLHPVQVFLIITFYLLIIVV